MDMIFEFFLVFVVGCWVGSRLTNVWNRITFREILKDLGVTEQQMRDLAARNGIEVEDPQTSNDLPELEVRIEQHQGILFAFRKDTDQFLGQGPDRDQLVQRLTENLTNVRVVVAKEDGADHLLQKNNG